VTAGIVGFSGTFLISVIALPSLSNTYNSLDISTQCEFASRVHSSLHGVVVPTGVIVCLNDCGLWPWDSSMEEAFRADHCESIQSVFSLVIGYFIFDLGLTLYYQYEHWQVFAVHHIVGMAPFIVTCFICENLPLLLGGGICVELANPGMNLEAWLEQTNRTDTKLYGIVKWFSWVMWLLWRVLVPSFLMYGLCVHVIPNHHNVSCYVISYISGSLIFVFCLAVFGLVVSPGLLRYTGCIPKDQELPVLEDSTSYKMLKALGTTQRKMCTEVAWQRLRGGFKRSVSLPDRVGGDVTSDTPATRARSV